MRKILTEEQLYFLYAFLYVPSVFLF